MFIHPVLLYFACFNDCCVFWQEQFKIDPEGGLTNMRYKVESRQELMISGAPCTVISTLLECDTSQTPWCQFS